MSAGGPAAAAPGVDATVAYVRWREIGNRGFLAALDGLRASAVEIAEHDEAERCDQFLHQLDPDWDRR